MSSEPQMEFEYGIVGTGAVAHALVRALLAQGRRVLVWGRDAEGTASLAALGVGRVEVAGELGALCASARTVVLAISDPAIDDVAARVAAYADANPALRLLHTSGAYTGAEAMPAAARAGIPVGSVHPLVAVRRETESFEGRPFAVEGASGAAGELADALGAVRLELPDGADVKRRYHALATMVATGVVALVERAARELSRSDTGEAEIRRAYAALARSAAENIGRAPIEDALTGAVAREDDAMVAAHIRALEGSAAEPPYFGAIFEAKRLLGQTGAVGTGLGTGGPLVVSLVPASFAGLRVALEALSRTREADVAEVRLDRLPHDPDELERGLGPIFGAHTGPILCAIHGEEAFGDFAGAAPERLALLAAAARAGATAIDIDVRFATPTSEVDVPRVLSTHATGPDAESLDAAYGRALGHARPGDLIKLVPACESAEDGIRLLRWLHERRPERAVAFGSGEAALFTRLLAPRFGSRLVYVRPSAEVEAAVAGAGEEPLALAAPGQPPADEVRAVWAAAEGRHQGLSLAAVVGRPIGHSASPAIHGAAAAELGLDAALVPIAPAAFSGVLELPLLAGMSVTAPFKTDAMQVASQATDAVRAIGAANTLYRTHGVDGWQAANTDVDGIAQALIGSGARLAPGTRAVVVGAGGAARAAAWALASRGVDVTVAARSAERANELAEHVASHLPSSGGAVTGESLDALASGPSGADIVVHATPLGTGLGTGRAPVPGTLLRPGVHVLDAVYDPARTELLRRAERAGAVPISGGVWFLEQAWAQFQLIFAERIESRCEAGEARAELFRRARARMEQAFQDRLSRAAGGRDRAPVLCLVGLRGAGKSTLGARAAEHLGLPFSDLDAEAARAGGFADAGAFIEARGLDAFRDTEAQALAEALASTTQGAHPRIVACGGGVVERPENRDLLRRAWVVWLDVDLDVARARVAADAADPAKPARPSVTAEGADEFTELRARRAPWFREVASRRIELDAEDEGREDALGLEILRGWGNSGSSDSSRAVLSSE